MNLSRKDLEKILAKGNATVRGALPEIEEKKGKKRVESKKVFLDGHWFDSKAEASIYFEYKHDPEVKILELQPFFELLPAFERFGEKYQSIDYTPDFRIIEKKIEWIVEVKSIGTIKANSKSYPMRRKLFLSQNPGLRFLEIIFDGKNRIENIY